MKRLTRLILISFFGLFFIIQGSGCVTGGGNGDVTIFLPTWINAIWTGDPGEPNDRMDVKANDWVGSLCAANLIILLNNGVDEPGHLQVINNCKDQTVTMALCLDKGALPQPEGGLKQCATDPFDTSFTQLTFLTLNPGPLGFTYPSTVNLAVNVFFCSDAQQLVGPPIFPGGLECL